MVREITGLGKFRLVLAVKAIYKADSDWGSDCILFPRRRHRRLKMGFSSII